MKNFVQPGDVISVTATAAVAAGSGQLIGSMFGFAVTGAATGEDYELAVSGVFDAPKLSAQAWTVGARVYWDAANSRMTTVATDNKLVGVAVEAAANPSDTGRVRLNGSFSQ